MTIHRDLMRLFIIMGLLISPKLFAISLETRNDYDWQEPSTVAFLQRTSDPLILPATLLAGLQAPSIEQMGVFRYTSQGFIAIPFQIDEKTNEGEWVFPYGAEANPEEGNGLFDGEDELVLMALDLGSKAPVASRPSGAMEIFEICVNAPEGGMGYAYLARFPGQAPLSTTDYVQYNPQTKMVSTPYYRMGFHPKFPIGIGHLAILPAAGGDGINTVDRMKVRVDVETVFGFDFKRHEEDFSSEDVAYIDGPVRVLRRTRNQMSLILSIPTPSAIIDNLYYRDFFLFPTEVEIPFRIGLIVDKMRFRTSVDLTDAAAGRVFYHSHSPRGTVFDGKMSADEKQLGMHPVTWMAQMQDRGVHSTAWLNRLMVEKSQNSLIPLLYYNDELKEPDPPEEHEGHFGDTGFIIENFPDLEAGLYRLVSVMYCVPGYRPGMEQRYLNIIDNPLTFSLEPF